MATRIKTIEYIFPTNTNTLASATRRDFAAINVYIPEASSAITFKSVSVEVVVAHDQNGAGSLTSPLIGIKLGAVAFSDLTLPNPQANSNESEAWNLGINVTPYFITNWTGTNMTCQVGVQFGGITTSNHSAKLRITYEYNDSITTHIKTVRIPIETTRTLLTTSYQTIGGTTSIPAFQGTYLPELGLTIRQVWIELWGFEATTTNGNFTAQYRINGGTPVSWWRSNSGLISARYAYGIGDITAETLTSASSLECILLTTTNRMGSVGGMVCCTYEFDSTGSTTIFNSLIMGAVNNNGWVGGTTVNDQGIWEKEFFIEEPAAITLKESGVALYTVDSGTYNLVISVSGQTEVTYTNTAGTLNCGTYSCVHRIDAGGQTGISGLPNLQRGKNKYRIQFRSTTANAGWCLNGFMLLNYTSGKSPDGVGSHNNSVFIFISEPTTPSYSKTSATRIGATIPETYYHLQSFLCYIPYHVLNSTDIAFSFNAESLSGDTSGYGWVPIYCGQGRYDNENGNQILYGEEKNVWKRWNGDVDYKRINITTPRYYRFDSDPTAYSMIGYWYTYHSISYTISGICYGYSGDGSNIPIEIYRVLENNYDEKILNLTTTSGGVFSGKWIDNTETLYASARQDDQHVGRSKNSNL